MAETAPLGGTIPILVTPFDPGDGIDEAQLAAELQHLERVGVRWVGIGYGSEVHRLDEGEVADLVACAVDCTGGRLGVVGNAEVTGARAGVTAVRRMADAGAHAAMVRLSGLAGVAAAEIRALVAQVAADGGLPLVVQDAPQHTGLQLSPELLAELLTEVPGVAAVKVEPAAPAPKISAVVAALGGRPGTILGGLGGVDVVHELERGAAGTMPGPAFPEVFAQLQSLVEDGDGAAARRLLARVLPFIVLGNRSFESFLVIQKHLLRRRGVLGEPRLRPPHAPVDPGLVAEVDELATALGLDELLAALA